MRVFFHPRSVESSLLRIIAALAPGRFENDQPARSTFVGSISVDGIFRKEGILLGEDRTVMVLERHIGIPSSDRVAKRGRRR